MNNELNRFFDDCAKEVRNKKQYIRQYIEISDEDIKNIKVSQPNINIAEVTRYIAELGGVEQIQKIRGGKITTTNKFTNKFDNALTCLWFCFYRFIIVKRTENIYGDFDLTNIAFEAFFKFMKYVKINQLKDGPQVTAYFHLIFRSVLADYLVEYSSPQYMSYNDLINTLDAVVYTPELFDIDDNNEELDIEGQFKINKSTLVKYIIEYIINHIENDYQLQNDINNILNHKAQDLTEYSKQVLEKYRTENNLDTIKMIEAAIDEHVEYRIQTPEELLS